MLRLCLLLLGLLLAGCVEHVQPYGTTHQACYIGEDRYFTQEELPLNLYASFDSGSDVVVSATWVGDHGTSGTTTLRSSYWDMEFPFTCNESIQLELFAYRDSTVVLQGDQPYDVDVDYHWDLVYSYVDRHGHFYDERESITYPSVAIDLYAGESVVVYVEPVSPRY